jgi:hypothetical protein
MTTRSLYSAKPQDRKTFKTSIEVCFVFPFTSRWFIQLLSLIGKQQGLSRIPLTLIAISCSRWQQRRDAVAMKPLLKFTVLAQADVQGCTMPLITMFRGRWTEGSSLSIVETMHTILKHWHTGLSPTQWTTLNNLDFCLKSTVPAFEWLARWPPWLHFVKEWHFTFAFKL